MRRAALLLLAISLLGALPAAAKEGEYLFDTLKKPAYRASWNALIKSKRTDHWLEHFARTKDGPCTPGKTVKVGGVAYEARSVCEAHNCGGNFFTIASSVVILDCSSRLVPSCSTRSTAPA